ncbi:hypothetical protein Csa_013341 [Cucumis sativus]|nr:hypothetical protein Csa_013341 [Cucumis sativus]
MTHKRSSSFHFTIVITVSVPPSPLKPTQTAPINLLCIILCYRYSPSAPQKPTHLSSRYVPFFFFTFLSTW